jgi:long-chain acyl-CoA synthetase
MKLPSKSILGVLRENAGKFSGRTAISYKKGEEWVSLTYDKFYERILMAARGLRKAGVSPGDRVIILSENRAGWAIADFGTQAVRAVPVPVYATSTPDQVEYVINHAEAKIIFVSNRQQYEKILQIRDRIPGIELVVSFERFLGDRSFPVYTLYQLSEISHPLTPEERGLIEAEIDKITAEDLITIIYTSGTTGVPKGVMLTQHNMLVNAAYGFGKLGTMAPGDVFLSFLPLSHVLERTAGYHAPLMFGGHVAFAESVDKVVENIIEVRPTAMVSVPRLFEKIYSRIYENAHQLSPAKRRMFHWAVDVGKEYVYRRYVEKKPLGALKLRYQLADKLVFAKIRERFGGRLRFFVSGGAPLDKTINEFMWTIGIPTFEGYGLTEASPAITLNTMEQVRFGAVGTVLDQTEVRLADDGELLVRGPQVMKGYYKNPEATAEAMGSGWLMTGDIARIDNEGYIYIVDRKKEIIITAGGKNIPPQPIENELKLDKYISQAFVYGDRKPYLVALLTPNLERLIELAQHEKIDHFDMDDLVSNRRVVQLFAERLRQVNDRLPTYETIKKFAILPWDFSIEGGELTPTLKLRRKMIYEKYRDRIETLYLDSADGGGTENTQNGGK